MHSRLVLFVAVVSFAAPAAAQGRWLDTFAVPGAFDGSATSTAAVYAVVPDGAGALVAGDFAVVDDVRAVGVARWTGAAWEPFGGGLRRVPPPGNPDDQNTRGVASAVVRASDGAVWVAGAFDAVVQPDGSELATAGLARWANGAWTVPGRLVGGGSGQPAGYALAVQGQSVVVGGDFSELIRPDGSSLAVTNVARWTAGAWEPLGELGAVFALAILPDGRLVAPGRTETPDGNGATAVEVWDGAAWQPFTGPLAGPFTYISALHVDGSDLYVGGRFEGGVAASGDTVTSGNVVRWDGATWQPLGRGVAGVQVNALATDATGLLVGGYVDGGVDADGSPVASPGLVRWTGAAWERRTLGERRSLVLALARTGTATLVGGQFDAASGTGDATVRAVNIAALPADGGLFPLSARTGRDGTVSFDGSGVFHYLAPDGCGGVHVFTDGNAGPRPSGVVRTWGGDAWEPVPEGIRAATFLTAFPGSPGVTYRVNDLAAVPGSCDAFVLAGQFGGVAVDGVPVESRNVVRWTGQAWQPLGRGTDGFLATVAVGPDGAVTVGGFFSTVFQADGTPVAASNVARWTEAGGWQALGGGVRYSPGTFPVRVFTLLAEVGGAVVVGGRFDTVVESDGAEQPARNVARWTGAAWEPFGGPVSTSSSVSSVSSLAQWQGRLVVSGDFEQVEQPGGALLDARGVAAYDGTAWSALPGLDTSAGDLAVGDGELFVSTGLAFGAARWTGTAWTALDSVNQTGGDELAFAGRSLYLSGGFETAGGVGSPGLAEFDLDATVAAEPVGPATSDGGIAVAPNPSRGTTTLTLRLDAPGPVRLVLLDALGRTVAVLADGERAAGEHTVPVDVSRLPAGVYTARLAAGGAVQTRRLTVVR